MPSDMKYVMKPKTTYYCNTYDSPGIAVYSITDVMFVLSEKEIYNANNATD